MIGIPGSTNAGRRALALLGVMAALPWAASSLGAQERQRLTLSGERPSVHIPAGEVRVVAGGSGETEVEIRLMGPDAGRLRVETLRMDGSEALVVRYPEGEDIVFPDGGGSTELRVDGEGIFSSQVRSGRGDRVRVRNRGRGVEAWAEVTVRVPRGATASVHHGMGSLVSEGVDGDLLLRSASGSVTVEDHRGELEVELGSGRVEAAGVSGSGITLATGSGSVVARGLKGGVVRIQTGSGSLTVSSVEASTLRLGTGSGSVALDDVESPRVSVRTGSGRVLGNLLVAPEELEVQTGSGGVQIDVPRGTGAALDIRTGSGGIEVDLPVQITSSRRTRLQGSLGDGSGTIRITTGSGGVRIGGG